MGEVLPLLFDEPVATAEIDPLVGAVDALLPEEASLLGQAARARQLEFQAGRHCARLAMRRVGAGGPVLRGLDRSPIWPAGIVGSIAHTRKNDRAFCGAAVARTPAVRSIGLDLEIDAPLEAKLWRRILRDAEKEWISELPEFDRGPMAMVVFSAKESVYKCQYALSGTFLEFSDVQIEPPSAGYFAATLLREAAPFRAGQRFEGRFVRHSGLVATGVTLVR